MILFRCFDGEASAFLEHEHEREDEDEYEHEYEYEYEYEHYSPYGIQIFLI